MPFSWGRAAGGWHRARCWAGVALASGLAYLPLSATPGGAEPRVSYGGPPGQTTLMIDGRPAQYAATVDRLLSRLAISDGLRLAARDFVAVEMAKGLAARPAVEAWVMMKRTEEIIIRCTRVARASVECVVR